MKKLITKIKLFLNRFPKPIFTFSVGGLLAFFIFLTINPSAISLAFLKNQSSMPVASIATMFGLPIRYVPGVGQLDQRQLQDSINHRVEAVLRTRQISSIDVIELYQGLREPAEITLIREREQTPDARFSNPRDSERRPATSVRSWAQRTIVWKHLPDRLAINAAELEIIKIVTEERDQFLRNALAADPSLLSPNAVQVFRSGQQEYENYIIYNLQKALNAPLPANFPLNPNYEMKIETFFRNLQDQFVTNCRNNGWIENILPDEAMARHLVTKADYNLWLNTQGRDVPMPIIAPDLEFQYRLYRISNPDTIPVWTSEDFVVDHMTAFALGHVDSLQYMEGLSGEAHNLKHIFLYCAYGDRVDFKASSIIFRKLFSENIDKMVRQIDYNQWENWQNQKRQTKIEAMVRELNDQKDTELQNWRRRPENQNLPPRTLQARENHYIQRLDGKYRRRETRKRNRINQDYDERINNGRIWHQQNPNPDQTAVIAFLNRAQLTDLAVVKQEFETRNLNTDMIAGSMTSAELNEQARITQQRNLTQHYLEYRGQRIPNRFSGGFEKAQARILLNYGGRDSDANPPQLPAP